MKNLEELVKRLKNCETPEVALWRCDIAVDVIEFLQRENAELSRKLEEASKDAQHLREIMRRTHDDLEIRMSLGDYHVLQILTKEEIEGESAQRLIQTVAALLYAKLQAGCR